MLDPQILDSIYSRLKTDSNEDLLSACRDIETHIGEMDPKEIRFIADALMGLLFLDTEADPALAPAVDKAVDTLATLGPEALGVMIEGLTDSDLRADYLIARALGRMGKPAVAVLKDRFRKEQEPYRRGLALFALSRIDDPALIEIFPEVVSALDHESPELRDMAAQAIGTMVDCVGGACLSQSAVDEAFDKLMLKVSDTHAGTRAKAVRSIGRLAKADYLSDDRKKKASTALASILAIDGMHEWDRAFIVRREAEDAYKYLTGVPAHPKGASELCSE